MIKTLVKKTVKNIVVSNFNMDNNDPRVRQLRKTERAFKKAYGVDTEVKYIDVKYKELVTRPTVNGYHNGVKGHIVVFVDGNLNKNTITLLHELTHAYQKKYMFKQFHASKLALANNKVSYIDSWHEVHARHCADILALGYIGKIDLRYAMEYAVVA